MLEADSGGGACFRGGRTPAPCAALPARIGFVSSNGPSAASITREAQHVTFAPPAHIDFVSVIGVTTRSRTLKCTYRRSWPFMNFVSWLWPPIQARAAAGLLLIARACHAVAWPSFRRRTLSRAEVAPLGPGHDRWLAGPAFAMGACQCRTEVFRFAERPGDALSSGPLCLYAFDITGL
jgi:hypothetical protein